NAAASPALNPNGIPLFGGMIRLNLAGYENAYAYPAMYLDGKTRISVGAGAQYQPHAGGLQPGASDYDHYVALATDLFADVAIANANLGTTPALHQFVVQAQLAF